MTNNLLMQFLQEIFLRFKAKSPTFFVWWQRIAMIVGAVTGLPEFLAQFNIVLPPSLTILENKTIAICSMVALFMSLMPAQSTTVAISEEGELLKKTDHEKMPFTAKTELKAEIKKEAAIKNTTGVSSLPVAELKK